MSKILVIDTETTGLKAHRDGLHGIGARFPDGRTFYFLHGKDAPEKKEFLKLLRDPSVYKLGHNITFDLKFIKKNGYEVNGKILCTRTMAHALDENNSTALDTCVERYVGPGHLKYYEELKTTLAELGLKHVGMLCAMDIASPTRPYSKQIGKYCIEDVENTWLLFEKLMKRLKEKDKVLKRLFPQSQGMLAYLKNDAFPFLEAQVEMELKGVRVDLKKVDIARKEYTRKIEDITDQLNAMDPALRVAVEKIQGEREMAKRLKKSKRPEEYAKTHKAEQFNPTFSWDTPSHVYQLLFTVMKVSTKGLIKTKSGVSLNEENLVKIAKQNSGQVRKICELVLERRAQSKLRTTYVGEVGKKGLLKHVDPQSAFVYPEYSTFLTTRRLSCHDPNMQNTPRGSKVRGFFVPDSDEYVWVHADASQLELRIAAHESRDPLFMKAYNEGLDLHVQTIAHLLDIPESEVTKDLRQVGKTCNFLLIFFGSKYRLQTQLLNDTKKEYSVEQCQEMIDSYFERYKRYRRYLDEELDRMLRHRVVVSESGCVRRLPDLQLGQWLNWKRKEFTGPQEILNELQADVYAKRVPQPVLEVPEEEQVYKYASMRFGHAKKQGFNFKVQHLGAVATKRSIVALHKAGYDVRCTVHDSIDIMVKKKDVLDELPRINAILEAAYPLRVPLKWEVKVLTSFNEEDKYDATAKTKVGAVKASGKAKTSKRS